AQELTPVLARSIAKKIEATRFDDEFSASRLINEARALLTERLRAAGTRARPLAILSDQVARGNLTVSTAVVELADADELGDLAALIGMGLRMHGERVVRNIFVGGDEPLILLCRAAALDLDASSATLRMRNRRRCATKLDPAQLIEDYVRV